MNARELLWLISDTCIQGLFNPRFEARMLTPPFGYYRGDTLPSSSGELTPTAPELFIGLVGAVGTDLGSVGHCLKDELHRVGYSADIIRLSDLLLDTERFAQLRNLSSGPEDERINQLMTAGDDFRSAAQRGD